MLRICIVIVAALALFLLPSAGAEESAPFVHLAFDEGAGLTITDSAGTLPDADMQYGFAHAVFMEDQAPQWRAEGIQNGCLLFDGSTTYVSYKKNDISVSGDALTISVWVAPRSFEWDDPNAADNGTDSLTGIISQSNKVQKQGFILGYQRFGRLSFQVGTGDDWLSIWTNGDNLQKYEWNHVAATFDAIGGEMCLYLNGVLVASRSVPQGAKIAPAKNRTLLVGRNGEAARLAAGFLNVFGGYMDELKLYDRALSAKEIAAKYDNTAIPPIEFEKIWLQNLLTGDTTRPQYHASPYQFWMNEPHAPLYYNGMYHLFFQENMTGAYWRNICWGHFVSKDMASWKPVKEAITPTEYSVVPDGVWSGAATLDANGVPLLFFTAGNDDFGKTPGLISNQNIGVAYPADLSDPELIDWHIYPELAIAQKGGQGRRGEFRDPHIWREGDTWCMLICSGSTSQRGGTALLYTTDTLELKANGVIDMNWQYHGPIYEMENQSVLYGTSWELPIVLPVSNAAGTITRHFFAFSPAPASIADNKIYYFVGDFDLESGKFTPDASFEGVPRLLDYGCNVFTGPSAFIDPVSGQAIMMSIMQDQRSAAVQGASGWAHNAGLARRLWLSDDGSDLMMPPVESLYSLQDSVLIDQTDLSLDDANALLTSVDEDMYYLQLTVDLGSAEAFTIELKKGGKWDGTTLSYDALTQTIHGSTQNKGDAAPTSYVSGALPVSDGLLNIEIFVDRSLVEAFFNNTKSISMRAYTDEADSTGISLHSEGDVSVMRLYVAAMSSTPIQEE